MTLTVKVSTCSCFKNKTIICQRISAQRIEVFLILGVHQQGSELRSSMGQLTEGATNAEMDLQHNRLVTIEQLETQNLLLELTQNSAKFQCKMKIVQGAQVSVISVDTF